MRIVIFFAASMLAAAPAWAEDQPVEPPKAEKPAAPEAKQETFTDSIRPPTQSKAPKPRESGLDQPLCTGE